MGGYHDDDAPSPQRPAQDDDAGFTALEQVAAPLVLLAPPVAPSPGLFGRIAAAAGLTGGQPGYYVQRAQAGHWRSIADGVELRILHPGGAGERRTVLLRMMPGSVIAAHHHDADEECYVVDGEVTMGDMTFARGDFLIARAGTDHPPVVAMSPSLLLVSAPVSAAARHP